MLAVAAGGNINLKALQHFLPKDEGLAHDTPDAPGGPLGS